MNTQTQGIRSLSHELRLFGIHSGIERRSDQALADGFQPLDYLRLILEDEKLFRQQRVAKILQSRAKFRSDAELESWDQSYERGLSKPKMREVASLGFYANKENLLITGATGTGKTHMSIAIGKRLCLEGVSVVFGSTNFLLEEASAEKTAGKYLNWIKKMTKTNVIVIDDFALREYTHEEAGIFLDLFEERYRKGVLIVTSQVDPQGWKKLFEDPVIAESIVDRMVSPSKKIELKGPSYRDRLKIRVENSEKTK
jgi:DNA replication protein DnaC